MCIEAPLLAAVARQWLTGTIDPLLPVAMGSFREMKCLTIPDKVYKVSQNSHRVECVNHENE